MRTFFFCISFLFVGMSVALTNNPALDSARELAQEGVIVDQSSLAQSYWANSSLDVQEANMYRLDDTLIRQEALKIALKLRGIEVPPASLCRGYFLDLPEEWVCRVVEFAADYAIVTRENSRFRPHDSVTLAESLKILMISLQISLTDSDTSIIPGIIPDWQKRIILTLREKNISFTLYDNYGHVVAHMSGAEVPDMTVGIPLSHRMTRGEFFQLVVALSSYQSEDPTAHCTVYNDGCNDCTLENGVPICTKRACFWKGIPSCSACESGYTLENNRCVKKQMSCVTEGGYAGGGHVMYPDDLNALQCCVWLTRSERKDGTTFADAGYTCINQGDMVCDARYENATNSSDCRLTPFDSSICQDYYDGCNSCSRTSNGQTVCTMMYCPASISPAYCRSYTSYNPVNLTQDTTYLDKITQEIKNYTANKTCVSNTDCRMVGIGAKACGWPTGYLYYSSLNIDTALLATKIDFLATAMKQYNQRYNIMSDCSLLMVPAPQTCQSGVCQ